MIATPACWPSRGWWNSRVSPLIRISPSLGRYAPQRIFISVDLPAPFSPTIACTSPAAQDRSTPSSTRTPRNSLPIPCISIRGGACGPGCRLVFSTLSSATLIVRSSDEQGPEGAVGQLQPCFDPLGGSAPNRVLVLYGQHPVEPSRIQRVDIPPPVHVPQAGDPVAPPPHVPRVLLASGHPAEEAEAVALGRERLGILGVGMGDPVDVRPQRLDRVDPEPEQVRGVEVQEQPELEHPLPQLGRVGEVARISVGVPALHDAVLDHQRHAPLAGVVDEGREYPLGLAQVLGHAAPRIAADESPHRDASERGRRVDAGANVGVDRLALARVRMQVVVVVGERREGEAVIVERLPNALGLRLVERLGRDVRSRERPVAEPGPGGQLECLVAVAARPRGDLLQRAVRHAGGQQAELHGGGTSVQLRLRLDSSTASVIWTALRPSVSSGSPSGNLPSTIAPYVSATKASKQSWKPCGWPPG